ncbi:cytochrome c [Vibrio makurazakiensis]|uniref:c-type cytochrome n=1 Tax=Vibrio makurazakiensis TaxID=2910250 RepID=UPI003D0F410B
MIRQTLLLLPLLISTYALSNEFGDPKLGKLKSPSCVFCHGASGTATNTDYPNLAGQDLLYLFNSMKAYQAGQRSGSYSEMMKTQLRQLNDDDLKDIAAFYSSQSN